MSFRKVICYFSTDRNALFKVLGCKDTNQLLFKLKWAILQIII